MVHPPDTPGQDTKTGSAENNGGSRSMIEQGQRPCRGLRPQSAPTFYRVSQGLDEWVAVFMEIWGKNWGEMLVDL